MLMLVVWGLVIENHCLRPLWKPWISQVSCQASWQHSSVQSIPQSESGDWQQGVAGPKGRGFQEGQAWRELESEVIRHVKIVSAKMPVIVRDTVKQDDPSGWQQLTLCDRLQCLGLAQGVLERVYDFKELTLVGDMRVSVDMYRPGCPGGHVQEGNTVSWDQQHRDASSCPPILQVSDSESEKPWAGTTYSSTCGTMYSSIALLCGEAGFNIALLGIIFSPDDRKHGCRRVDVRVETRLFLAKGRHESYVFLRWSWTTGEVHMPNKALLPDILPLEFSPFS